MSNTIKKRIYQIIESVDMPQLHNVLWLHPETHILSMWINGAWTPVVTHSIELNNIQEKLNEISDKLTNVTESSWTGLVVPYVDGYMFIPKFTTIYDTTMVLPDIKNLQLNNTDNNTYTLII